jgi:hypothetical protein
MSTSSAFGLIHEGRDVALACGPQPETRAIFLPLRPIIPALGPPKCLDGKDVELLRSVGLAANYANRQPQFPDAESHT